VCSFSSCSFIFFGIAFASLMSFFVSFFSMLDINLIREDPKLVKENLKKRNQETKQVDELIKKDKEWRALKGKVDALRHKRNQLTAEITKASKEKKDTKKLIKEAKAIPKKIKEQEEKLHTVKEEINKILYRLPNIIQDDVPIGKSGKDNKVIKTIGAKPKVNFKVKNHVEFIEEHKQGDFELGTKTSGHGFNYLTNDLALLDRALQQYALDLLLKNGFELITPPLLLNKETMAASINLSEFKDTIYKIEEEDLYLIGTAENTLVALYKNKTFTKKDLPKFICAITPCFRKELGSHGVDQKGLFRMHQFNKVEQVCFCTPEQSKKALEKMQSITEQLFKSLKIPFRVVEICSGDLSAKQAKAYDIEAWFPRQKQYAEVTSASNCTDYQARKLNTRVQDGQERKHVHILNNTMIATSRAMVAILENNQQKNGTVKVPSVLVKYMKGKKLIGKKN